MKKIMAGILVLVPIVILLVVGSVSSFVSTRAYIAVEEVLMDKDLLKLELSQSAYDLNELIKVTVLPSRADVKTATWTISDMRCLDEEYEAKYKKYLENKENADFYDADGNFIGEKVLPPAMLVDAKGNEVASNTTGKLKINSYCMFYAFATAEVMFEKCLITVGGYDAETASIKGVSSVKVGESALLSGVYTPVDAIVNEEVWISSDPSIASVDGNGVVRGLKQGVAEITVKVKKISTGEYVVNKDVFRVTVTKGASAFGNRLYSHEQSFELERLGIDVGETVVSAVSGCKVYEGTFSFFESDSAVITADGERIEILLCDEMDIDIENARLFAYDQSAENGFVLEKGGQPLELKAVWKSALKSGFPQVDWDFDDTVVSVDSSGAVKGIGSGLAEIEAVLKDGDKSEKITIAVQEKVTTLKINMEDSSLAIGLKRETVFASERFTDIATGAREANWIDIGVKIPVAPKDSAELQIFYTAFNFTVDDTSKAEFVGNRLVFKPNAITEFTTLTVTVSAKYPKYPSLSGYTTEVVHINVAPAVQVSSFGEMKKASVDKVSMCLMENIPFEGSSRLDLFADMYGNNKLISAKYQQVPGDEPMFQIRESGTLLSNVRIRPNEMAEEITDLDDNLGLNGYCVKVRRDDNYTEDTRVEGVRMEFSIFENARSALGFYSSEVTMEGCIVRNTLGTGIYIPCKNSETKGVQYTIFTIKNCVMSNFLGLAMSLEFNDFAREGVDADAIAAEGRCTTVIQQGFLDIYNWQELTALQLVPQEYFEDFGLSEGKDLIDMLIRSSVESSKALSRFRTTYEKINYFHLGFMSMGIKHKSYAKVTFEDKRYSAFRSSEVGNDLINRVVTEDIIFWGYTNDVTDLLPKKGYTIGKNLIDRLHGIGVN